MKPLVRLGGILDTPTGWELEKGCRKGESPAPAAHILTGPLGGHPGGGGESPDAHGKGAVLPHECHSKSHGQCARGHEPVLQETPSPPFGGLILSNDTTRRGLSKDTGRASSLVVQSSEAADAMQAAQGLRVPGSPTTTCPSPCHHPPPPRGSRLGAGILALLLDLGHGWHVRVERLGGPQKGDRGSALERKGTEPSKCWSPGATDHSPATSLPRASPWHFLSAT